MKNHEHIIFIHRYIFSILTRLSWLLVLIVGKFVFISHIIWSIHLGQHLQSTFPPVPETCYSPIEITQHDWKQTIWISVSSKWGCQWCPGWLVATCLELKADVISCHEAIWTEIPEARATLKQLDAMRARQASKGRAEPTSNTAGSWFMLVMAGHDVTSKKLTWNVKTTRLERASIFQSSFFQVPC